MSCPNCHCPSCFVLADSTIPSTELPLPPSELMTTDRAATNSEVAHSRDVINSAEKTFLSIEAKITDLEKRKAELLGLIGTHRAAITPLRSFPPEMLVEIFGQFVATADTRPYSKNPSLFTLMGVCSRWRRIVMDTPRLWTKISTAHPMIDSWVRLSNPLPLHVELDLRQTVSHLDLEALIPHSHRWEHVDFRLDPRSSSILARVRTCLPSLKRLSLYLDQMSGTVDFCEVAPQLTEVKLMGICEIIEIKLPWKQLRVCTLDNSDLASDALRHAKNLRRLHLDTSKLFEPPWLIMPGDIHFHHLGLDTLIIDWGFMDSDPNLFFSSVTLPSLQTLEVLFGYCDSEDTPSPDDADVEREALAPILAAFFERSCTHLTTLKLTDIAFSPDGLIKCLAVVPSLTSLDIQFDERWHVMNGESLCFLNVDHPRHILPRLRSLSLRGQSTFPRKFLDALITSRRDINPKNDGVAVLKSLTLECSVPHDQSTDELPQFHRFVSQGLNITYGEDWDIYNDLD